MDTNNPDEMQYQIALTLTTLAFKLAVELKEKSRDCSYLLSLFRIVDSLYDGDEHVVTPKRTHRVPEHLLEDDNLFDEAEPNWDTSGSSPGLKYHDSRNLEDEEEPDWNLTSSSQGAKGPSDKRAQFDLIHLDERPDPKWQSKQFRTPEKTLLDISNEEIIEKRVHQRSIGKSPRDHYSNLEDEEPDWNLTVSSRGSEKSPRRRPPQTSRHLALDTSNLEDEEPEWDRTVSSRGSERSPRRRSPQTSRHLALDTSNLEDEEPEWDRTVSSRGSEKSPRRRPPLGTSNLEDEEEPAWNLTSSSQGAKGPSDKRAQYDLINLDERPDPKWQSKQFRTPEKTLLDKSNEEIIEKPVHQRSFGKSRDHYSNLEDEEPDWNVTVSSRGSEKSPRSRPPQTSGHLTIDTSNLDDEEPEWDRTVSSRGSDRSPRRRPPLATSNLEEEEEPDWNMAASYRSTERSPRQARRHVSLDTSNLEDEEEPEWNRTGSSRGSDRSPGRRSPAQIPRHLPLDTSILDDEDEPVWNRTGSSRGSERSPTLTGRHLTLDTSNLDDEDEPVWNRTGSSRGSERSPAILEEEEEPEWNMAASYRSTERSPRQARRHLTLDTSNLDDEGEPEWNRTVSSRGSDRSPGRRTPTQSKRQLLDTSNLEDEGEPEWNRTVSSRGSERSPKQTRRHVPLDTSNLEDEGEPEWNRTGSSRGSKRSPRQTGRHVPLDTSNLEDEGEPEWNRTVSSRGSDGSPGRRTPTQSPRQLLDTSNLEDEGEPEWNRTGSSRGSDGSPGRRTPTQSPRQLLDTSNLEDEGEPEWNRTVSSRGSERSPRQTRRHVPLDTSNLEDEGEPEWNRTGSSRGSARSPRRRPPLGTSNLEEEDEPEWNITSSSQGAKGPSGRPSQSDLINLDERPDPKWRSKQFRTPEKTLLDKSNEKIVEKPIRQRSFGKLSRDHYSNLEDEEPDWNRTVSSRGSERSPKRRPPAQTSRHVTLDTSNLDDEEPEWDRTVSSRGSDRSPGRRPPTRSPKHVQLDTSNLEDEEEPEWNRTGSSHGSSRKYTPQKIHHLDDTNIGDISAPDWDVSEINEASFHQDVPTTQGSPQKSAPELRDDEVRPAWEIAYTEPPIGTPSRLSQPHPSRHLKFTEHEPEVSQAQILDGDVDEPSWQEVNESKSPRRRRGRPCPCPEGYAPCNSTTEPKSPSLRRNRSHNQSMNSSIFLNQTPILEADQTILDDTYVQAVVESFTRVESFEDLNSTLNSIRSSNNRTPQKKAKRKLTEEEIQERFGLVVTHPEANAFVYQTPSKQPFGNVKIRRAAIGPALQNMQEFAKPEHIMEYFGERIYDEHFTILEDDEIISDHDNQSVLDRSVTSGSFTLSEEIHDLRASDLADLLDPNMNFSEDEGVPNTETNLDATF